MFLFRKKKKLASPFNSNWVSIGEYYFDKKNMKLIFRGVEEGLSGKESDLLELFYSNKNKTLEREYILNTVWNDEGDYIGRTLDVSVSKLRKRLREDSTVKIINIRGVGYRFVINS
jgi:DNA-binding response OmpR family regulator